jgi:hypothetical protein
MASNLETYSALRKAIGPRDMGGKLAITQQDSNALCGLVKEVLVDQGF